MVDAGADLLKANKKGVMAKDMYGKHVHLVRPDLIQPLSCPTVWP